MSAEDSINVKSSIEKQFKERPKELISKLKEYEKDIFNKSFSTRFYNLDVHKAAFALPEFMRIELVSD